MITTFYYAGDLNLLQIPARSKLAFTLEQAILNYALSGKDQEIPSLITACIYHIQLLVDDDIDAGEPLDHTTDMDYLHNNCISVADDAVVTHIRDLLFSDQEPLRVLARSKTFNDIKVWMEAYRPVKIIDAYFAMNQKVMVQLATISESKDPLTDAEQLQRNAVELEELRLKLINEFSEMENEIVRLNSIIGKIQS